MSIKFLLDTNILSEAKRPQPNSNVMANLLGETGGAICTVYD
jgi:predicted nucleic acid-binding protein